jgi:hypothetical protein
MGYKEKEIINKVLMEGSKKGRLFRINSGQAWVGRIEYHNNNGIKLKYPRVFHGAPAGTPDCIGWESKTLCEIICNKSPTGCCSNLTCDECNYKNYKIAIFKAVEVKTGKQKLTNKQENWKRILIEHGGIYEERRE